MLSGRIFLGGRVFWDWSCAHNEVSDGKLTLQSSSDEGRPPMTFSTSVSMSVVPEVSRDVDPSQEIRLANGRPHGVDVNLVTSRL